MSVRIPQLHSPLTINGSGAHGPVVFTLTLDREDLDIENHEEKLSCSPLRYLYCGTGLIDFQLTEVGLQVFKHRRLLVLASYFSEVFICPS